MQFHDVSIASLAHDLPSESVTSAELEGRIGPLYERLGLSVGRLELMTGIRERRFYPRDLPPSAIAAAAGELALARCNIARERIGLVIHAGVCRDFLEPATASVVHQKLGLSRACQAFDLSNACLGFANAMVQVALAIERGAIETGLVVSGENGRELVESTLAWLQGPQIGRSQLKRAFASLTIGAGGAACVLSHARFAPDAPRLVGETHRTASEHVGLCREDRATPGGGLLMETDSEGLLVAGNALAGETFGEFLRELDWSRESIRRVITHQVGVRHRALLYQTLGLSPELDYPTVETLGNLGSVSLPLTLSMAAAEGVLQREQRVACMGIASGLQCQMLGLVW